MDIPIKFIGLSAGASALVETLRETPEQPESEIIEKALRKLVPAPVLRPAKVVPVAAQRTLGCDLGQGAVLRQDEKIYCFLRKANLGKARPDGVAVARDGALFIDDRRVEPQRGAWLQAALKVVQNRAGDLSQATGEAKSLNAWIQWFVQRNEKLVPVGDLRSKVHRRGILTTELSAEDLGL